MKPETSLADLLPLWRTLRDDGVTILVTPALDYVGGLEVTPVDARLLPLTGSTVVVLAVAETVTVPLEGTTKLTVHMMLALTARLATGGGGTQVTTAPVGKAPIVQPADAALLGPLLTQVTVPLTLLPAGAFTGKPVTVAAISA